MYTYTKLQILRELSIKVAKREQRSDITKWAYERFCELFKDEDGKLEQLLIDVSCMQDSSEGEQFYDQIETMVASFFQGEKIIFHRLSFVRTLRKKIKKGVSIDDIMNWASSLEVDESVNDQELEDAIKDLVGICCTECFPRSYEEFTEIADKLMVGEDVKL